jgi:uncharacterized protein YuzE
MTPEKITFSYDAEADILYVAFGISRPGIGLLINDNLLLRVDQEMKELVGLSIFDYRETMKKNRLALYGLKEMSAKAKNLALSLLQAPPLNRFFLLLKAGQNKHYVQPTLHNLRIETLLMAA